MDCNIDKNTIVQNFKEAVEKCFEIDGSLGGSVSTKPEKLLQYACGMKIDRTWNLGVTNKEQYNYLFAIVADALISRISRYENYSWNEPGCVPLWAIYLAELLMKEMKADFQTRAMSTILALKTAEISSDLAELVTRDRLQKMKNYFLKTKEDIGFNYILYSF